MCANRYAISICNYLQSNDLTSPYPYMLGHGTANIIPSDSYSFESSSSHRSHVPYIGLFYHVALAFVREVPKKMIHPISSCLGHFSSLWSSSLPHFFLPFYSFRCLKIVRKCGGNAKQLRDNCFIPDLTLAIHASASNTNSVCLE